MTRNIMKKVMIFIGGYLPGEKYGGPVTSIHNFTEQLGDDYEMQIVCCNHDFGDTTPYQNISNGWNIVGKAKVLYLKDEALCYKVFRDILAKEKPDMIYASGIMHFKFNAPMIRAARKLKIPVLLAPRGDLCKNALKIKEWKKKPFLAIVDRIGFFKNIYFHSTMEEESTALQRYLHADVSRIFLLPNLPSSTVKKDNYNKEAGVLRVLFISRIQSKKNLLGAIRIVNQLKGKTVFDIYGPIENEDYWQECKTEIEKSPDGVTVSYKGALSSGEAKNIYLQYDCFLFPTLSENYGHVIAEALMHDCPIVISKGTTPWDDVTESDAGAAFPLEDTEAFAEYLENLRMMDDAAYHQLIERTRNYARKKIPFAELKRQYKEMLNSVLTNT